MKIKSSLLTLLASATLFVAAPLFAQSAAAGKLIAVTEKDAAWVARESKSYPLTVCVISDEKLGSMGDSPAYIYRAAGKPDRLVLLCCEGCEEDFTKEPAKYLAKIDAAPKAKKGGKK